MKRIIPPHDALNKAMSYCSKAERCRYDIQRKLYNWGINSVYSQKIIDELIKQDFYNESRYISGFIRGKFILSKWGKVKIKHNLLLKGFDESVIDTEIDKNINEEEYLTLIQEQIERKNRSLHKDDEYKRKSKLIRFAQSRGYETELALNCVDNLFQ